MKYLDIFSEDDYIYQIEKMAACQVARIPIYNTNPKTEYWIDSNAKSPFVVHKICGRCFVDRLLIRKPRTSGSVPSIVYRTIDGVQTRITLDRAVYAAFILRDRIPKNKPVHLDGNILNCALPNLQTDDLLNNRLSANLEKYQEYYSKNFSRLVRYCMFTFYKPHCLAEDIVQDSFICSCSRRTVIKNFEAVWMLSIQKLSKFRTYKFINQNNEFERMLLDPPF